MQEYFVKKQIQHLSNCTIILVWIVNKEDDNLYNRHSPLHAKTRLMYIAWHEEIKRMLKFYDYDYEDTLHFFKQDFVNHELENIKRIATYKMVQMKYMVPLIDSFINIVVDAQLKIS